MGIRKIEIGLEEARILFDEEPKIDTGALIELIQSRPQQYRFEGGNKLRIYGEFPSSEVRFGVISELLGMLAPGPDAL